MVPTNKTGSCGMMDSLLLRSCRPIVDTSMLSIDILPESASTRRNKATPNDDLPVK